MRFEGYASTFNEPYDMGPYDEVVAPGAFTKTLSGKPSVVLNINHGQGASGLPIARTTSGTLRLAEDARGLHVEATLDPADPDVQLVATKLRNGNLDGAMSFAFICRRDRWTSDYLTRTIVEADISHGDVSIVVDPANPHTSSTLHTELSRIRRDSTIAVRRRVAAAVSAGPVVLQCRSFTLDGRTYTLRDAIDRPDDLDSAHLDCARCGGRGTIDLGYGPISCPNCKAGTLKMPEGDRSFALPDHTTRARLQLEKARSH